MTLILATTLLLILAYVTIAHGWYQMKDSKAILYWLNDRKNTFNEEREDYTISDNEYWNIEEGLSLIEEIQTFIKDES